MPPAMYLRANKRIKDGKEHRYWSVEGSRRLRSGRVVQRRVLYSGEESGRKSGSVCQLGLAPFDHRIWPHLSD